MKSLSASVKHQGDYLINLPNLPLLTASLRIQPLIKHEYLGKKSLVGEMKIVMDIFSMVIRKQTEQG